MGLMLSYGAPSRERHIALQQSTLRGRRARRRLRTRPSTGALWTAARARRRSRVSRRRSVAAAIAFTLGTISSGTIILAGRGGHVRERGEVRHGRPGKYVCRACGEDVRDQDAWVGIAVCARE